MYAFFSRIGTQIWNSIPYLVKLLKRSSFHKKIKELLLNFLRSEDDYVEVSRLIKLFNTLGYPLFVILIYLFLFSVSLFNVLLSSVFSVI